MKNIGKKFGQVQALSNVNFAVEKGEIHALCGENGAGKSTLMKILSGVYSFDEYDGQILVDEKEVRFTNPKDSENKGVCIIYQEMALVPTMNICENILLGQEPVKNGFIDWDLAYFKAQQALKEVKLNLNPATLVSELGIGEQQLVEIARALVKNANILILDEPTAALSDAETDNLLEILNSLRAKGKTCIYISHRLKEVFRICDKVTILRDGQSVSTHHIKDLTENTLIAKMVGRAITNLYPKVPHIKGDLIFQVKNWTVIHPERQVNLVDNVSFELYESEVLGIAGLMGAGRTELVMSLFGAFGKVTRGEIWLDGNKLRISNEADAIKAGLALVSEDRKRYGLVLDMELKQNATLSSLSKISSFGFINKAKEIFESDRYVRDLKIKTSSIEQFVRNLSGGNQQKVVLSKWLMTHPRILILDEPTRGIDVGAKYEIYAIIEKLLKDGVGIIMISSELPEVLGMCDRILVMSGGRITGEFTREEATQENIMACAVHHNERN